MFRQKTTIVVGAGASCEVGLPSGEDLKVRIGGLCATTTSNAYGLHDEGMIQAVKTQLMQNGDHGAGGMLDFDRIGAIRGAADRIRRGLPLALSIDNFLHSHQHDSDVVQLGKTAIAMAILGAERRSALFDDQTPAEAHRMSHLGRPRFPALTSEGLAKSWYPPFAQLMMSGVQKAEAASALTNLRFVIFNYDRCLEQFLWMAFQDYFDLSEHDAAKLLAPVEFIHPYGSLGPLPWQTSGGDGVALGSSDGLNMWQVGSRIRTFTESVESVESALEPRIKAAMEDAGTIILLGFGYLDQNVDLLRPGAKRNAHRIISTAYQVLEEDLEIVRRCMGMFARKTSPQLMIEPETCRALFHRFRLQLSLT